MQLGYQYLLLKNKVNLATIEKGNEMKKEVLGRISEGNVDNKKA